MSVRKRIVRDATEVVESIAERANTVRETSAELSTCITEFEAYLSTLRGRIETICYLDHPDYDEADMIYLAIKLQKAGKNWTLHWATYYERHSHEPDFTVDWKPLVDAPLKIKVDAIEGFEKLLESIDQSQKQIVVRANSAKESYAALAAKLKRKEDKQ